MEIDCFYSKVANKVAKIRDTELVKELGSGLQGTAFLMANGRVIKITDDAREYHVCSSIIGKDIKHIYNIDATYRLLVDGEEYYAIIEECLDTSISKQLKKFDNETDFICCSRDFIGDSLTEDQWIEEADIVIANYPHYKHWVEQVMGMARATVMLGITNSDMHSSNIGQKDNTLVLFDLGFSNSGVSDEGDWLEVLI